MRNLKCDFDIELDKWVIIDTDTNEIIEVHSTQEQVDKALKYLKEKYYYTNWFSY